jgi:5-deoxy-D-glucuronate isomerase
MNISSLIPPVNTAKLKHPKRSEVAVAGSKTNEDASRELSEREQRKQRGQDRRRRNVKPLLDMRSGSDRRKDAQRRSINLSV